MIQKRMDVGLVLACLEMNDEAESEGYYFVNAACEPTQTDVSASFVRSSGGLNRLNKRFFAWLLGVVIALAILVGVAGYQVMEEGFRVDVFAASDMLWWMMVGLLGVVGLVISVAGFMIFVARHIASRIVRPIVEMASVVDRVGRGDLEYTCAVVSDDEIGGLAESINAMIASLRTSFADMENQQFALDQHAIVSRTNVNGDIVYANDKFVELSGYSREELIGQNHRMIKSDEHDQEFYHNLWKTIASKNVWTGEIKNLAKDGSSYWVRATILPFRDDTGKIIQYVAIRTDITETKESEFQVWSANDELMDQRNELFAITQDLEIARRDAELASKAKSEFLANMSHEIRTPMTAILGFAESLKNDGDIQLSTDESADAVDTILRNGNHLLAIINDILDLSKIEAGKIEMERICCSPAEIVLGVQKLLKTRSDAKGLLLEIEFERDLPKTILSDPTRLRQVLVNIVGNAIKFTEHGSVKIVTRFVPAGGVQPSPMIRFDVIDTGIGLTEEQIGELFQAFSQADSSTTRKFGGTGLGLDISKRFAEMLGGDVAVESVYGQGSVFSITVETGSLDDVEMLADPLLALSGGIDEVVQVQRKGKPVGCRVLLAEDGPDNLRLISHILRKAGALVEVAVNGKVAFEKAMGAKDEGKPFDVILMDMQMPIMSGYESATALRQAGYEGLIIALTAHAMAEDRKKCIDAGCDDFATKPIDRATLIGLLDFYSDGSASAA